MTGKIVKHREYSYESGGKKILVPAHIERHNPHVEMMAVYYVAFELERHDWNVGFAGRETQEGFDLYAEKNGRVLRVQVKGRTAGGSGFGDLPRDPHGFDVLVGVRLGGYRDPEAFVAAARELRAMFRHRKSDNKNEWRPFSPGTLQAHLNRWDKLDGRRRSSSR